MIRAIKKSDKEYPEGLKHIFGPPEEIFVDGEIIPEDENAVAIVGTRRATLYGLKASETLAYDLAIRGITVVSGMARGIDSAAHRGALKAGGRTIAVMGSGHDNVYPSENKKLYSEIAENGAVISEYPPGTLPFAPNFPKRNRIISGISKGVVVVEAPRKSGALITANFALQQGREVFAMPGNISSAKSSGTNALIKEGAKLIETAGDILDDLKYIIDIKDTGEISAEGSRKGFASLMSPEETLVFDALSEEPKAIDEISDASGIPVERLSRALVALELKRLIRALPGENFVKA